MIVPEISPRNLGKKTVIIFDLDGTLTESKSNLEKDMAESLGRLENPFFLQQVFNRFLWHG